MTQKSIPINWNIFQDVTADRWVATIINSPQIDLNNKLKLSSGDEINIKDNSSTMIGLNLLRYSPKRTFVYGISALYKYNLFEINKSQTLYRYDVQSVGTTFIIGYQKPNIVNNKHFYFNVGFSQYFTLSQNLNTYNNVISSQKEKIGLNNFPTFGFLEFGLRNDEFLRWNPRSSLKNLSLSIDLPFFNRSNLFSENIENYNQNTVGFLHAKNPYISFRINYQQFIDVNGKLNYDNKITKKTARRHLYLPPLISIEDLDKKLFGRIFVDFTTSTLRDSINIGKNESNPIILSNAIINNFGIGYNLHFGNYSETTDLNSRTKNFYVDVFGGITLYKQLIHSNTIDLHKYDLIGLKANLGLRAGLKNGLYALVGGSFRVLEFSQSYFKNFEEMTDNVRSPYKNRFSIFVGTSFKNLVTIKVTHIPTQFLRSQQVTITDNFYYSLLLGF